MICTFFQKVTLMMPSEEKYEKIYAASDESRFEPSYEVIKVLKELSNPENFDIFRRYQKYPELIQALSKKYNLHKERVFLESGIIGIIHRVFDYMINSGSSVLLPEFGYPYYFNLAKHHNSKIMTFKFNNINDIFSYNIEDLINKIKEGPNVIVIIDPEQPLGFSIKEEDLRKILENVNKDQLVVLDQAHEGFSETNIKNINNLLEEFPNLLIARGFSKLYGISGIRVGYALCGQNVKNIINFNERYLGFDNIAQKLAIAILNSEEHYKKIAQIIREQKAIFKEKIEKLPNYKFFDTDSGSILIEVPENQIEFIEKEAKEIGIEIRRIKDYSNIKKYPQFKNWYKITIGPKEHNDKIIDLFNSVSWLYNVEVNNQEVKKIFHTREGGYTVNRIEIPCEKIGILMGFNKVLVPPDKEVSAHKHLLQDEIFEFYSEAQVIVNEEVINVNAGSIIVLKPGDIHSIKALENKFARFTALRFPC